MYIYKINKTNKTRTFYSLSNSFFSFFARSVFEFFSIFLLLRMRFQFLNPIYLCNGNDNSNNNTNTPPTTPIPCTNTNTNTNANANGRTNTKRK